MDVSRYVRKRVAVEIDRTNELYPHNLSLYSTPPNMNIQLSQFEDLAVERVRVLKIIEYASLVGHHMFSEEWKNCIFQELKKQNLHKYLRLIRGDSGSRPSDIAARVDDSIAHHILRLAYCRTEQMRKWCLNQEKDLFRLRLMHMSEESISEFMRCEHLDYRPLSPEDIAGFRDPITCSTVGTFVFGVTKFYKVQWHEVALLASHHKVFLRDGFAYLPSYEITHCLITIFRRRLSENLAVAQRRIDSVADTRLNNIFANLHEGAAGINNTFDRSQGNEMMVTPSNIDMFAKQNFPLCMRSLHDRFRADHHLKHQGRLQYLFFIKGIGMLYEDALHFWREEMTRKIDDSTFTKRYEYDVKHCYGQVGNRRNYSPYGCAKIISLSVGPSESHGCPYKHWDVSTLVERMQAFGLDNASIKDIAETKQAGHFQIACGKFFKAMHKQTSMHAVNHPNNYFNDSCKLLHQNVAPATEKLESKLKEDDIADVTMAEIS